MNSDEWTQISLNTIRQVSRRIRSLHPSRGAIRIRCQSQARALDRRLPSISRSGLLLRNHEGPFLPGRFQIVQCSSHPHLM